MLRTLQQSNLDYITQSKFLPIWHLPKGQTKSYGVKSVWFSTMSFRLCLDSQHFQKSFHPWDLIFASNCPILTVNPHIFSPVPHCAHTWQAVPVSTQGACQATHCHHTHNCKGTLYTCTLQQTGARHRGTGNRGTGKRGNASYCQISNIRCTNS